MPNRKKCNHESHDRCNIDVSLGYPEEESRSRKWQTQPTHPHHIWKRTDGARKGYVDGKDYGDSQHV